MDPTEGPEPQRRFEIVARSVAKKGGPCAHCSLHIGAGDNIYKVNDGVPRSIKHGPGAWVGDCCVEEVGDAPNAPGT